MDFETEHFAGIEFFAADQKRLQQDVKKGLAFHKAKGFKRLIYGLVPRKPSVSFSMMLLALLFIAGWIDLLLVSFAS